MTSLSSSSQPGGAGSDPSSAAKIERCPPRPRHDLYAARHIGRIQYVTDPENQVHLTHAEIQGANEAERRLGLSRIENQGQTLWNCT